MKHQQLPRLFNDVLSVHIMNLLKKIIAAVFLISFVVFVAFFGRLPALRYVVNISVQDACLTND